jgi:adenosylmethionine-8-amino-7-oxononanoate aminotransferase
MATVDGHEFLVTRADGVWLWDDQGRRYLDATASLWSVNVGHGRREIVAAVTRQMQELDSYSIFNDYTNRPAAELAERLSDLAPVVDARVFLGTGGGDGIETAAKLARQYWSLEGRPERTHLIGRTGGFHGGHGFGTSVGGIDANRDGFGPLVGGTSRVRYDSLEALEQEIGWIGPESVAAVFVEPVMGAGGVLLPPDGYLKGVAEICRQHDVLLVLDEVICAFGRLGAWFASERFELAPDMIVFAKAVTSGYQPVGGVIVADRVWEPFWSRPGNPFRTGPTYAGHPVCCAAALANLDIIEREDLLSRARELEVALKGALDGLSNHGLVSEVRAGLGVMAAVEIAPEAIAAGVSVAAAFHATRERGVLVRPLGSSLGISPPLTIGDRELALIPEAIAEALQEVGAQRSADVD